MAVMYAVSQKSHSYEDEMWWAVSVCLSSNLLVYVSARSQQNRITCDKDVTKLRRVTFCLRHQCSFNSLIPILQWRYSFRVTATVNSTPSVLKASADDSCLHWVPIITGLLVILLEYFHACFYCGYLSWYSVLYIFHEVTSAVKSR